jgi:hypothetical protein
VSDVADAKAPQKAAPVKVASVEQSQTAPGGQLENAPLTAAQTGEKPVPKKRVRKHAKVDFGRFEGY